MPPPSRRQRVSRLNKHQPQRQKHQHVSNEQDTVWLPDQSTETSLIGEDLYAEFRKPDSVIRILLTSDAMAHGADVSNITLCVQYGMFRDKSINMMWQRLGRAVRALGMRGRFVFLVEQVYDGDRGTERSRKPQRQVLAPRPSQGDRSTNFFDDTRSLVSVTSEVSVGYERESTPGGTDIRLADKFGQGKKYRRRSPTERRANLPEVIYLLVNPAGQCLRGMIMKHYKQEASASVVRCCSVCCPELLDELESEPATVSLRARRRKAMMESVEAWLNDWINKYYADRKPFWKALVYTFYLQYRFE
jgi:helicase-like protein